MKHKTRKLLSILLALVMVAGLLPLGQVAYADGGPQSTYTVTGLNATATFAYEPGNPAYAKISDASIPVFYGDNNPPSSYYRLSAGPLFRDSWLDVPQWEEPYSGQTVYGRLTLQTTSECPSDILIDYENMDKDQVNISIEGYTVTVLVITPELIDGRSGVRILYSAKRNGNIVGLNLTIGGFWETKLFS